MTNEQYIEHEVKLRVIKEMGMDHEFRIRLLEQLVNRVEMKMNLGLAMIASSILLPAILHLLKLT